MKILEIIKKDALRYLLLFAFVIGLVIYNFSLCYPDCNDFYELSRICLLMDDNVKYCVNNNWGFAHPLSCWITTIFTGDLLISQRLISSLFSLIFVIVLLRVTRNLGIHFSKIAVALLLVFLSSPWMLELALSVHLDIVPITLIWTAVSLLLVSKKSSTFLIAGFIAGMSYWFRFHFLSFAVLFPILTFFLTKKNKTYFRVVAFTAIGTIISIIIPHLLCLIVYGVFSISNEKFVLAYAFGLVDWSYESALMLDSLNTIDILRNVDWKMFILRYGYHFVKSGLFPIVIIFVAVILTFIRKNKNGKNSNFDFSSKYGQLVLMASYGFFAVVPFTLVRGFTYRLEAAFVFLVIPALFGFISNSTKKQTRIITSIFLLGMLYQHIVFWHAFNVNKNTVTAIAHGITTTIPVSVLKKEPERILCCVDFYNPYNKYRLCNPMVFAGWGVRFIPFIENFGYLNMNKPFTSELYSSAKYICLPSSSSYFPIDSKLEKQNRQLLKDKDILILEK